MSEGEMVAIEALTFDVTGTLIHCPEMPEIYSDVLTRHGSPIEAEAVRLFFPVVWQELDCLVPSGADRFSLHEDGSRGWWGRLLERLCELAEAPRPSRFAAAELYSRFSTPDAWQVFPEVTSVLESLRAQELPIGVVANWDNRLPALLEALDLHEYFSTVIFSEATGLAKPDARMFRLALGDLKVSPEAAAHIGDSMRLDVEGAVAAGMTGIHIDRGEGCEAAAANLEEALGVVERRV